MTRFTRIASSGFTAALSILAVPATKAAATMPDVSGIWAGATRCPLGMVHFKVDIKGASGTFGHSGFDPAARKPQSFPVKISSFQGHQGTWIRLMNAEQSDYFSGLLSRDNATLQMDGMGDCTDFTLTRSSSSTTTATVANGPAISAGTQANPWVNVDGFAPSRIGPPNGDAIIDAQINEMVALTGTRLGPRKVRYSVPPVRNFGAADLTFDPVRIVGCNVVRAGTYDCRYFGKITMFAPDPGMMGPIIQMANRAAAKEVRHRFEFAGGQWRSSSHRQKLYENAQELWEGF